MSSIAMGESLRVDGVAGVAWRDGHGGYPGDEGAYGVEWCVDGVEAVGVCAIDLSLAIVGAGERY